MAVLKVDSVEYAYRDRTRSVPVLQGLSAVFETGRIYAAVGSSGSGKTTLLSLLAGLDVPTRGSVLYDGISTADFDRDAWRLSQAAVIFQNYNLFAHLTALENAAYPLYAKNIGREEADRRAAQALQDVGLGPEQFGRRPARLSGGEQQRVAIARALAAGSRLILADEPTGNLDEENGENIFGILCGLAHDKGCCVIMVTHDPQLAALADEVLTLKNGRFAD